MWNKESFYLVENGRQKGEKSIILIENGSYVGYGFVPFHVVYSAPDKWKKHIEFIEESVDRDTQTILRAYIKNNPQLSIVKF